MHGNPTWSYLWRTLLAAGSDPAHPWRVVAVDQLDMGFSERTGTFRRLADRINDLGDLTDALGLDGPVVTVGHDWGGVISLGWALAHPQQLAGVVLTNTAVHQPAGSGNPAGAAACPAPRRAPLGNDDVGRLPAGDALPGPPAAGRRRPQRLSWPPTAEPAAGPGWGTLWRTFPWTPPTPASRRSAVWRKGCAG